MKDSSFFENFKGKVCLLFWINKRYVANFSMMKGSSFYENFKEGKVCYLFFVNEKYVANFSVMKRSSFILSLNFELIVGTIINTSFTE